MNAIINGKIILKDGIVEDAVLLYSDVIEGIVPADAVPAVMFPDAVMEPLSALKLNGLFRFSMWLVSSTVKTLSQTDLYRYGFVASYISRLYGDPLSIISEP